MKYLITLFCLFVLGSSQSSYGQSIDSTEIKLNHVKDLFIKNLITAQEYEAMKAQILGIKPSAPQSIIIQQKKSLPKMDSLSLERLNSGGNANTNIGSFFIVGSAGLAIGTSVYALKHAGQGKIEPLEIVLPILSVALFIPGVCLVVEGTKQRHRYREYKDELAINISPTATGLAYKF